MKFSNALLSTKTRPDTDLPHSHSLSHRLLTELFVPIDQIGQRTTFFTWPNFSHPLPIRPWTHPSEHALLKGPPENRLTTRIHTPQQLRTVPWCHHSSLFPTPHLPVYSPLWKGKPFLLDLWDAANISQPGSPPLCRKSFWMKPLFTQIWIWVFISWKEQLQYQPSSVTVHDLPATTSQTTPEMWSWRKVRRRRSQSSGCPDCGVCQPHCPFTHNFLVLSFFNIYHITFLTRMKYSCGFKSYSTAKSMPTLLLYNRVNYTNVMDTLQIHYKYHQISL